MFGKLIQVTPKKFHVKALNLSVFISSRNNDLFSINGQDYDSLSEVRLFLREELEKELLFGEKFLTISINETFHTDTDEDSYNECLVQVRKADFVIVLYNGNAGWAPPGYNTGICHAELEAALQVSNKKTAIIDISSFFKLNPRDEEEKSRNELFAKYIAQLNRFSNPLKLKKNEKTSDGIKNGLSASIRGLISNHLVKRVENSNYYYNLSKSNEATLDWKKLKYDERADLIKKELFKLISASPDLKKCICIAHAIPDKMSVSDAKSFTGRPYLNDQNEIDSSKTKSGPIHFIGVYDSATETQVKGIIGQPDVSVISGDFGYYLWDQNMHTQLVVLTECNTPAAIQTKHLLFENWANSSAEMEKILNRATARYLILESINYAQGIANNIANMKSE